MAKRCKDCGRYRGKKHLCINPKFTWQKEVNGCPIGNGAKVWKEVYSKSPKDKVKRYLKEAEEILNDYDHYKIEGLKNLLKIADLLQKEENKK